jgi:hypothetical protein
LQNSDSDKARDKPRVSLAWAFLAVALLTSWQFLTVHYNWHDNWTALFCTGAKERVPPQLAPTTYLFANSEGYDGQMYRYVAHDPLAESGFKKYLDAPVLRYRRILVPALAFVLVGGRQPSIDTSYIVVVALFVLAGSYWLSRWAVIQGFHPAWGLTFLVTPATLISMDRMTVDVAIAAVTVGLAYYTSIQSTPRLYGVLVLACLARETGVLLVAAMCIYELWSRRFERALLWATASIPMLGWYLFLSTSLRVTATRLGVPRWFTVRFGWGIIGRILDPHRYTLPAALEAITRSFDVIAMLGIVCAMAASIVLLSARSHDPVTLTAVLFTVLAIVLSTPPYWDDFYSYSRVFTPLLIAVALRAVTGRGKTRGWWWMIIPTVLVDLRIGLQLGPQVLGILQGIAGR